MQIINPADHNVPYSTSPLLAQLDGIGHGFFGAQGGVSRSEYTSLNCGYSSKDNADAINENRQRVAGIWGVQVSAFYSLRQAHTCKVIQIQSGDQPQFETIADGMVSKDKGVMLGALGADCAPVLYVDPINKVVGAAHSGWKGALLGINEAVLEKMCDLGAQMQNIRAAIGPAMQQTHYEVKADFLARFKKDSLIDGQPYFLSSREKLYFDTPAYIHARLKNCGVLMIDQSSEDTFTQADRYFSYRRACQSGFGDYGRQVSVIVLR